MQGCWWAFYANCCGSRGTRCLNWSFGFNQKQRVRGNGEGRWWEDARCCRGCHEEAEHQATRTTTRHAQWYGTSKRSSNFLNPISRIRSQEKLIPIQAETFLKELEPIVANHRNERKTSREVLTRKSRNRYIDNIYKSPYILNLETQILFDFTIKINLYFHWIFSILLNYAHQF